MSARWDSPTEDEIREFFNDLSPAQFAAATVPRPGRTAPDVDPHEDQDDTRGQDDTGEDDSREDDSGEDSSAGR